MDSSVTFLLAIIGAVIAATWFSWMFGNQQLNLLVILLTLFAAISMGANTGDTLLKYVRVFTTVAMIGAGFIFYQLPKRGLAIRVFLPFLVIYVGAALYSDYRLMGLIYKSFFAFTFLGGVITAYTIRTREELVQALRFFTIITAVGVILTFRSQSFQVSDINRLNSFGLNPIFIGAAAATMLPFAGCLIFCERSIFWRSISCAVAIALCLIIMLTGSRSPALQAAVGLLVLGAAIHSWERRMLALGLVLATAVIGFGIFGKTTGVNRMFEVSDTRSSVFVPHWERLQESPWIGFGWNPRVVDGVPFQDNAHSAYLQVMMDLGFLGLAFFIIVLLRVIYLAAKTYKRIKFQQGFSIIAILPLSVLLSLAALSFLETPMIQGTQMGAMMFGFAIGLTDRLPSIANYSRYLAAPRLPSFSTYAESVMDLP